MGFEVVIFAFYFQNLFYYFKIKFRYLNFVITSVPSKNSLLQIINRIFVCLTCWFDYSLVFMLAVLGPA